MTRFQALLASSALALIPTLAAGQNYPAPSTLTGTEIQPCIQGGSYKACTVNLTSAFAQTNLSASNSPVVSSLSTGLSTTNSNVSAILSTGVTGTLSTSHGGTGLTAFSRSGNTTTFGTISGALTAGYCVQFDSSGNLVSAGGVCTTGGGGGTVTSGTANDLAYYATTGTAVTGLATVNNGVLVTTGAGVPSISTSLPNGLAFGTPASVTLTNATGLPISTGVSGLGTSVASALSGIPTGTGPLVLSTALSSTNASITTLSTSASTGLSIAYSNETSLSTGLSSTNSSVGSLSTSAQSGAASLSTGLSSTNSNVGSLSTSASLGLSTGVSAAASLSTSLGTTNANVSYVSTSASTGIAGLSTSIGAVSISVASLSTSTSTGISTVGSGVVSLSTGLSTTSGGVTSLSTALSTTNASAVTLSTSASTGLSTHTSQIASISTGLSATTSTVTSLSTSASTGISTNISGVTSLSTGISTSNYSAPNVLTLGADNTGATSSTAAFNLAIAALGANGGRIIVPAGTYNLATAINQSSKSIYWDISPAATFTGSGGQTAAVVSAGALSTSVSTGLYTATVTSGTLQAGTVVSGGGSTAVIIAGQNSGTAGGTGQYTYAGTLQNVASGVTTAVNPFPLMNTNYAEQAWGPWLVLQGTQAAAASASGGANNLFSAEVIQPASATNSLVAGYFGAISSATSSSATIWDINAICFEPYGFRGTCNGAEFDLYNGSAVAAGSIAVLVEGTGGYTTADQGPFGILMSRGPDGSNWNYGMDILHAVNAVALSPTNAGIIIGPYSGGPMPSVSNVTNVDITLKGLANGGVGLYEQAPAASPTGYAQYLTNYGNSAGLAALDWLGDWTAVNYIATSTAIGFDTGSPTAGLTNVGFVGKMYSNGGDVFLAQRSTDTSPTGYFFRGINAANSANLFFVDIAGNEQVASLTTGGALTVAGTVSGAGFTSLLSNYFPLAPGSIQSVTSNFNNIMVHWTNTGSVGAAFEFTGNGSTTPNKYFFFLNGNFYIANSANSADPFTLTDAGAETITGAMTATGYIAGSSTGLSCSGTPSASFASVGGIVTHC